MSSRPSSRERILDAAEEVVLKKGATHMTLDAVALKAGLSKGGLIYHFPSQRDLLQAMMKRFVDHVEARITKSRATLPASPVREIKAYILAWFTLGDEYRRTATALLAAVTREPEMLNTARKEHLKTMTRILEASSNPEHAMILSLATEGVWMSELLGISPFTNCERGRIKRTLLRLADEWLRSPAMPVLLKSPRRQRKMSNSVSKRRDKSKWL
ncbi:MAG: TetR/AcrR family transcriptional regulator [Kiritimatiellia bacterium]|nr:TetR/AcrR family transcriptional regulator [Kiritimatiellia bacterium]